MDAHQGLSDSLSLALFSLSQLHSLFISDEQQLAVQAPQDLSCAPKVKLGVPPIASTSLFLSQSLPTTMCF